MSEKRPTILLVDDDIDICRNISDILVELDYEVDMATSAEQALELVGRRPYDLALLDLKMPGMNGLVLYREIKRRNAGAMAVLVTGHADRGHGRGGVSEGIFEVLSKPVQLPRLFDVVNEALERPVIMIVDDDRELCASLSDVLREQGYRVFLAHDGQDAQEHLESREFQVVLIDMKLPRSDGTEVYRRVRASNPEARTIMITGHGIEMEPLLAWVAEEGADAICYKPFQVEKLLETITRLTPS